MNTEDGLVRSICTGCANAHAHLGLRRPQDDSFPPICAHMYVFTTNWKPRAQYNVPFNGTLNLIYLRTNTVNKEMNKVCYANICNHVKEDEREQCRSGSACITTQRDHGILRHLIVISNVSSVPVRRIISLSFARFFVRMSGISPFFPSSC